MTAHTAALIIFWLSLAILAHTFVGYPLLIALLARMRPKPLAVIASSEPRVTVIVAAFNEAARIRARIENLFASDLPADRLKVLVVSDGSSDSAAEVIRAIGDSRVNVIERRERSGKAACLNAAIAEASSELIVFTDARQRFAPDTIARLVLHFADPQVGAVSGALEIEQSDAGVAAGVDVYWRLEKFLRAAESRFDSSIGCTGAVYAIRRELFSPIPEDTVLDDVVIPMQIAVRGFRVLHDPFAVAFDPQQLDPARERIRKRRTLAGNFQMLFRYAAWLLPWRNRLWWQLISHKYLRVCAPLFLAAALGANAALATAPFYRVVLALHLGFYALAVLGLASPTAKPRLLSIPAAFVFLNWNAAAAFWTYLTSSELHRWNSAPRG